MSNRITIMIEDDILKKLRDKQAKQIKESTKAISFSKVINEVLHKNIK